MWQEEPPPEQCSTACSSLTSEQENTRLVLVVRLLSFPCAPCGGGSPTLAAQSLTRVVALSIVAEWRPSSASETGQSLRRCSHIRVLSTSEVFLMRLSLTTVSLSSAVFDVYAVTFDETRAIQYAKLAGAADCEGPVPSWSCGYRCITEGSNAETYHGATTPGTVTD